MNKVELTGRLTRNPDVREVDTQNGKKMKIARYKMAVERPGSRKNESTQTADFIPCVCFGERAEFVDKYLYKGIKIGIVGRIQTGSYKNKDGETVYTVEVAVEEHEFEEPKKTSGDGEKVEKEYVPAKEKEIKAPESDAVSEPVASDEGFMNIPQEVYDDLPYRT